MTSPKIPNLLFIHEKTKELVDERFKPILELDFDEFGEANQSFVDKWISMLELQTGFELQDGCTGIYNLAYSNRTGNLFYNSRKGIVKYQIEQLSSMIENMKRTQPNIILEKSGSLFLSPKETKILILNFDNLYFFQIGQKFVEIKVVKNTFRFTNAFWDDEDTIYLWSFKNKLFTYSIEKDSVNEVTEILECVGISRLHKNKIGIFEGNILHIFVERKRIKEVNLLFLSNDECPFFEDTWLIGISKINNLNETTFHDDDIYVLIGIYYKEYAKNDENPCNRYIFYLRGNFFDEGRLVVRGNELIEPLNIDESHYLSEDKKTKLPFSCIFESSEKFTIVLIEKSACLILIDATKKFEELEIFNSKEEHSYIIPSRSKSQFFKGMAIMKNMIPLESTIVNNDPFLKMVCSEEFKGQFMRLFFLESQTELIIEFPFSALTVTDDLIIRKYVGCTIDACDKNEDTEKFVKSVGRSKYIQILHEGERMIDGESKDEINIKDENQEKKEIKPSNQLAFQIEEHKKHQKLSKQIHETIPSQVLPDRKNEFGPLLPPLFETSLISASEKSSEKLGSEKIERIGSFDKGEKEENPFKSSKVFENSLLANKKEFERPNTFSSSYSSFSKLFAAEEKHHSETINTQQQQKEKQKEKESLLGISKKPTQQREETAVEITEAPKLIAESSIKKIQKMKEINYDSLGFEKEIEKVKLKIEGYSSNENTPEFFNLNSVKSLIKKWGKVFDENSPQVLYEIVKALENLSFYHKMLKLTVFEEKASLKESKETTSNNFIKTQALVEMTCYFVASFKNKNKGTKQKSVFGSALKNSHMALKYEEDQLEDYLTKRVQEMKRAAESLSIKTELEIKGIEKMKKKVAKSAKYKFDPNLESDSDNGESKSGEKPKTLVEKSKKQKQERKLILTKALKKENVKKELLAFRNKVIIIRVSKPIFSFEIFEENVIEGETQTNENIGEQALQSKYLSTHESIPHEKSENLNKNLNSKPKINENKKNGKIPMSNKIMNNQFVIPEESENEESENEKRSLNKKENLSTHQNKSGLKNELQNSFKEEKVETKIENKLEPEANELANKGSSFGASPFGSSPFGGGQFSTFSKLKETSTPMKFFDSKPDDIKHQNSISETSRSNNEVMNPLLANSTHHSSGIVETVIEPIKKEYKTKAEIKKGTVTNKEIEKKKKLESKSKSNLNTNEDIQEKQHEKKSEETKKTNQTHSAVVKIAESKKPTESAKKTQFGSQINDPFKKEAKVENVEQTKLPFSTKQVEVSTNSPTESKKEVANPFEINSEKLTTHTQNSFQTNENLNNPFKPSAVLSSENQSHSQQGKIELQNKGGILLHPSPVFGSGNSRFMNQNSEVSQEQQQTFNPSSSSFGVSTAGFKTFTNLTQSNHSFIQPFNQQQQLVGGQMQQSTFLQSQSQNNASNQQTNWIPNTPMNPFAQQQHGQSSTWVQNNQQNVQGGINPWVQNNNQSGNIGNAGINPSLMQPRK